MILKECLSVILNMHKSSFAPRYKLVLGTPSTYEPTLEATIIVQVRTSVQPVNTIM